MIDLRLTEPEFWHSTLRDLRDFYDRYLQAQKREKEFVCFLACEIVNSSFRAPKKQLTMADFGFKPKQQSLPAVLVEATPEEIHRHHLAWRRELHSDSVIEK